MAKIVGVLNITPDSFSDGGAYFNLENAISHGLKMEEQGADILDIGGESTRPFALPVDVEDELERVIPVIQSLRRKTAIPISIDTRKPKVAAAAIQAGATIINDVEGFSNEAMLNLAKETQVPIICMHMQGCPETMQKSPDYPEGIIAHLDQWFTAKAKQLLQAGIAEKNIIFDPGIGFGKTVQDNLAIIKNLSHFKNKFEFPFLIGVSRKSFMGKILHKPAKELDAATLALHCYAVLQGVDYVRVHDVESHHDAFKLYAALHQEKI